MKIPTTASQYDLRFDARTQTDVAVDCGAITILLGTSSPPGDKGEPNAWVLARDRSTETGPRTNADFPRRTDLSQHIVRSRSHLASPRRILCRYFVIHTR